MSWRTIVVTKRCKLDFKMGYLEIRSDDTVRIHLDEISNIVIENPAISITGCLIAELVVHKIKVVFCDLKRNPSSELVPLFGCHDCTLKIRKQLQWSDELKAYVWTEIVSEKIRQQALFLNEIGKLSESIALKSYISSIELNDSTNREGHAAKVYFNAVFGKEFTRSEDSAINAALNYGYSLILSTINREIVANGYLTQLGLFHDNMFNYFNLSCDLMEPYRVIIDRFVYKKGYTIFDSESKHEMLNVINCEVQINGTKQYLNNAIKIYCRSIFDALNERDISLIKNYAV